MILLISQNQALFRQLENMLSVSIPLISKLNVTEAQTYLHRAPDQKLDTELILLDATEETTNLTLCRQLCNSGIIDDIPVIAIIATLDDRQKILSAGADDYLLYPLLPEEINSRLSAHLHSPLHGFSTLLEAIRHMHSDSLPNKVLDRSLENLAMLFNAPSAWLLFLKPPSHTITLVSGYNLPAALTQTDTALTEETLGCLEILQNNQSTVPQVITCPYLNRMTAQETNGLNHHLSIPLYGTQPSLHADINHSRQLIGVLNLAYTTPPQFSRTQKRMIKILGQDIGILLEMFNLQQETQIFAMQNAFIVLLARIINERLNLDTILALTLEQVVPLLNAHAGEIWLTSVQEEFLQLTSSLSPHFSHQQPRQTEAPATYAWGQGLIGWIAQHGRSLQINAPTADPRFDPDSDGYRHTEDFSFLGVPLQHRKKTIGVLAIYKKPHPHFSKQDTTLLEGIANLTASAIVNAQLMKNMETYAAQQRALYEKSQQMQKQVLQTERLATVGRLTASLSHEINNPMQAIMGVLTLAMEELDNPDELVTYLQLGQKEVQRVVQLINRMRQVYRPQPDKKEMIELNQTLQEAIRLARKELRHHNITIATDLSPDLPSVEAIAGQLHLVFLSLLLNLGDAITATGENGTLKLRTFFRQEYVQVEFWTDKLEMLLFQMPAVNSLPETASIFQETDHSFGLSLSQDIVTTHGGVLEFNQTGTATICTVKLPATY